MTHAAFVQDASRGGTWARWTPLTWPTPGQTSGGGWE